MNTLINLIKMDCIALKRKSFYGLIVMTLLMWILSMFTLPHQVVMVTLFAGFVCQPMFNIAEQCGYNKLYGILPIKKSDIVASRYILAGMLLLGTSLVTTFLGFISSKLLFGTNFEETAELTEMYHLLLDVNISLPVEASVMFIGGCFFTAYQFTILFAFDTSKDFIASMIVCLILFPLTFGIVKMCNITIDSVAEKLTPILMYNRSIFILCCYLIGVVILFIGFLISNFLYNKKEL